MRKRWELIGLVILALSAAGIYMSFTPAPDAQEAESVTRHGAEVEVGEVEPSDPAELEAAEVPQLSRQELEALLQRKLEVRERSAAETASNPPSPAGLPLSPGHESDINDVEAEFHGNPAAFIIGRNNRNTNANNAALASTLAEPAAANNAVHVFAAGNFNHAEFSSNGGTTWSNVALPAGPSDAPTLCCDHDVIIDDARRVTFHSGLYVNSSATNGVVRIFVRRTLPAASCSYDIRNGTNTLPDYPHMELTKRFLYLTTNNIPQSGSSFRRIHRFNLDQMADCLTVSFTSFTQFSTTIGQRVWVPAEGTNNIETMYWGQLDSSTTFRIFSWPEAAAAPTSVTRSISAANFPGTVDCRGGTGNANWWGNSTSASIHGFRLRGAAAPGALGGPGVLAFYWNVGPDSVHTQGHIHAAVFSLSTLSLLAQPHIFNTGFCFGYPVVTANKRGDLGMSLAFGGRAGGGGNAAQGAVGIDDEFTSGIGFFGTFFPTASGTHNRADGRYGDYFTIHPYEPCEKWFSATNYALLSGTGVANVNSRYVEFGRQQSFRCYNAHRNQVPTP